MLESNVFNDCLYSLKHVRDLIEEHFDSEEKNAELARIQGLTKEYSLIEFDSKKSTIALEKVKDYLNEHELNTVNISGNIDDLYSEHLQKDTSGNLNDYKKSQSWKVVMLEVYDNDVQEVQQAPETDLVEGDYEEMQDSIFYSNTFTPPVDPICKQIIKNPYKNKTCGHIYEHKSVLQYIKSMKQKARCPYIGCSNRNLHMGDVVPDHVLQQKIESYIQAQTQEESADESMDNE